MVGDAAARYTPHNKRRLLLNLQKILIYLNILQQYLLYKN